MTNRREFLHAAAVAVLPIGAEAAQALPFAIHAVLLDTRHREARAMGARLDGTGAAVHPLPEGDVTQVWLRHIHPAWKQRPIAVAGRQHTVAGLTARTALFCLEQLGWPHGLRVVFHGEHVKHPDGRIEHAILRGAEGLRLSAHDLSRAGPLWPSLLASAMAAYPGHIGCARVGPSDAALAPPLPDGAQLLTSWIIAPV